MSDRAYSGPGRPTGITHGRGMGAAFAVYLLLILAPFTGGLSALVGWVVTMAAKGGADGLALDHLRRQARLFWTAMVFAVPIGLAAFVGWLTRIVLIGYPIGWAAGLAFFILSVWLVLTSFFGLLRLQQGRSPRG